MAETCREFQFLILILNKSSSCKYFALRLKWNSVTGTFINYVTCTNRQLRSGDRLIQHRNLLTTNLSSFFCLLSLFSFTKYCISWCFSIWSIFPFHSILSCFNIKHHFVRLSSRLSRHILWDMRSCSLIIPPPFPRNLLTARYCRILTSTASFPTLKSVVARSSETSVNFCILHEVPFQKTEMFVFAALRTWHKVKISS